MGRIKSRFVKSQALKIFEKGREEFSENFQENKKTIEKFAKFNSKKLRNTVTGYITRLARKEDD